MLWTVMVVSERNEPKTMSDTYVFVRIVCGIELLGS